MEHTQYAKPPIVEAIVELRLVDHVPRAELVAVLAAALGDRYCGERQQQIQVTVQAILHAETIGSTAAQAPTAEFLRTADGLRVIGCTHGGVSVHVLAPYPGWAEFVSDIEVVVAALVPSYGDRAVREVLVRYIDRVILPAPPVDLATYFRVLPPLPAPGPAQVGGVSVNLLRTDGAGLETLVTLRTDEQPGDVQPAVVLDFVARQVLATAGQLAAKSTWMPVVEQLHDLQYDTFKACIWPACEELFQ